MSQNPFSLKDLPWQADTHVSGWNTILCKKRNCCVFYSVRRTADM
jgi:hypothetical protein